LPETQEPTDADGSSQGIKHSITPIINKTINKVFLSILLVKLSQTINYTNY